VKLRGSWFRWTATNKWGFGWRTSSPFSLVVEVVGPSYHWSIKDNTDQYSDGYPENHGIRKTLAAAQRAAERRLIAYIYKNIINLKD
jgi:hypothetical protein